ncbi:UNVERIFIED_CONTAM: hypothetical protein NCL1_45798 [Trichonephila clavipes]
MLMTASSALCILSLVSSDVIREVFLALFKNRDIQAIIRIILLPRIAQPSEVSTAENPKGNTSILPVKILPNVSAPRGILMGGVSFSTSINFILQEARSESNDSQQVF